MSRALPHLARKVFNRIRYRLFVNETLILFEHDMHTHQETAAAIEHITPENVSDVLDFQPPRYKSRFEEFMLRGDTGYYAYLQGRCVHRSWVVHTPRTVHLHPLLPRRLEEGEAFIHYCETAPGARGLNIYPAVLSRIAEDFRKTGRSRRLLISTNARNESSIKGILRSGFKEIERVHVMALLGFTCKRSTGLLSSGI